jgi:hypothetical protein
MQSPCTILLEEFTELLTDIQTQNVLSPMRAEFNELVALMNQGIRKAVEGYNDPKIQYIDIDPAFQAIVFAKRATRC